MLLKLQRRGGRPESCPLATIFLAVLDVDVSSLHRYARDQPMRRSSWRSEVASGSCFAVVDAPRKLAYTQRRQSYLLSCVQATGTMILSIRGRCLYLEVFGGRVFGRS